MHTYRADIARVVDGRLWIQFERRTPMAMLGRCGEKWRRRRSAWRSCVENGEVVEEELGGVFISRAELGSNSELYVTPTSQS